MGLNPVLAIAGALVVAPTAQVSQRFAIDNFGYATSAAAAAAWRPQEGSAPVSLSTARTPSGGPAVAMRCAMAGLEQRAYWDRAIRLKLDGYGKIAFWIRATGDLSAVSGCNLYFRAGGGWYGAAFGLPEGGWRRIVLDRSKFAPEGSPGGWDAVDGIRIGFWKGQPRTAVIEVGDMEAVSSSVVVVRNRRAGRESIRAAEQMSAALRRSGIDAGTIDDSDVEQGGLDGKKIAVYPCNPQPTEGELDRLEVFVRSGGRLLVCYNLHPRLAALLGLEDRGWMREERAGQFAVMRFAESKILGLPRSARQASWNIQRVRPAGRGAAVLAGWFDSSGRETGWPAVVAADAGAYISHILLDDDPENKDRLLRALLGHYAPAIWEDAAKNALERAGRVSERWENFTATAAGIRAAARSVGRQVESEPLVLQAEKAYVAAQTHRAAGRWLEAMEGGSRAETLLIQAYVHSQRRAAGEFRAVWCHSAYGVEGMDWQSAVRHLKESGFTAVVPNMLWGGVADYPSSILPVRDRARKEGDQIALCLDACRKYGIQLHVWKVNWNLSGAPEEFVSRMRSEGRLQRTNEGVEERWLCPSNRANFELERDSMLEVARNYAVDGIHFDYIRYPDQSKCYCDGCRSRFEEQSGTPVEVWPRDVIRGGARYAAYQDFRRANITRLVAAVSEAAHRLRPGIKVSAAVFSSWPQCRDDVGQDWGFWVKQGYLDFVCPMDYTDSNGAFRSRIQVQRDEISGRIPLYPGIGASAPGLPVGQVIDQIAITREERSAGFILFNYDAKVAKKYLPLLGIAFGAAGDQSKTGKLPR